MANSWKDIIITPNRSSSVADPKIEFRGANVTVNSAITIQAYPASNGMLSFEGSAGQLFSITNDLTGSIFSVNDVSGIPSIEVFANGQINFAEFGGSVVIGNTATFVINAISATDITVAGNLTVSGTTTYINSTALNIGDNIITLNADLPAATAPTQNTGIEVNRGSSANVQFMWDETNDRWTTNGQPLATTSLVAAGAASGITTLAAGNTTITGFANATGSIQGGSTLTIAGAASGITTLAAGNTTITGFANVSTTLQVGTNTATFGTAAYVVANGNVGIGTASPGYKLHVAGTGYFTGQIIGGTSIVTGVGTTTDDNAIELGGSRGGDGNAYIDLHSTSSTDFEARIIRGSGINGAFEIVNTGTSPFTLRTSGNAPMLFSTASTERMRITGAGTVGIGTDTPRGTLSIGNALGTETTQTIHLGYATADFYGFRLNSTNTPSSFYAGTFSIQRGNGSAWTNDFVINNSGNVGISTNTPVGKLSVEMGNASSSGGTAGLSAWDNTYALFGVTGTSTSSAVGIGYNSSTGGSLISLTPSTAWRRMNYLASEHRFYNSATEALQIDSGNRLILYAPMVAWNATTPGTGRGSLHIGSASATTDAGGSITFEARDATAGNAQAGIYLNSGGGFGTRMYFATTNNYTTGSITAMTIDHVGIITANRDSFRAPIFYDSVEPAYYADPNATSNFLGLTVTNTISGSVSGNAGTATTLQTARNINGTSFNGSASITTASWGTSRTITIGSTGKAVDGSGNVSWSLSEIGAAATSHTHSITDISDAARWWNNFGDNHGTRTSFDATTPTIGFGWRYVQGSTNGPGVNSAGQYYSVYTGLGNDYGSTGAGSYGMQIAFPRNVTTPYLAIRYNESNSFGAWQKISAGYADSAGNATTAGGLAVHTGTNNEVNKIVRTDSNGYIQAGYIHSASGNEANNSNPPRVWGTNGSDSYLRTYLTSALSVSYAATAGSADQIDGVGFRNTGSATAIDANTIASNGITYYNANVPNFTGNATDGALYSQAYSADWQHQIAGDYRSGQIALRGKNNGTWQSWRTVLDASNYTTHINVLPALGNYVWSQSTLPTTYPLGIQSSFVGPGVGEGSWQQYGSVMTMRTYSGGGGSLQMYVPYGPSNGGTGLQVRFGNYDVSSGNAWTSWKTLLASDNYNSYAPTLGGTGATGTWSISVSGNAVTAGGLAVHTGTNNEANKIVRTDSNGYIIAGYLNSASGNEANNSNPPRVWGTNGSDSYLRTYLTSALSVASAVTFSSTSQNSQFNSIGIGTAASTTAGEIRASGNITAYYSSDRRFKTNIKNIGNALNKVLSLNGVTFDWTEEYISNHGGVDNYFLRRRDTGIIAQEVQQVLPEVVAEREDGSLAVRYEKMIGLLIEAMKEQQAYINTLEEKVQHILDKLEDK